MQVYRLGTTPVFFRFQVFIYCFNKNMASGSEENNVRVLVSNKGDIVHYLLNKKFSSLNFDDKLFLHKLKPSPDMKNLINRDNRGSNRSFNTNWYTKYNWLTSSEINNKLYCWNLLAVLTELFIFGVH